MGDAMTSRRRRGLLWAGILVAWTAFIVMGLILLGAGLWQTGYIEPTGEALARDRAGRNLIFLGSITILAAAGAARWMHTPVWACILVAVPAILVGGLTLVFYNSYFPHLSALVAFPIGVAGLISGLILARPLLRTRAAHPSSGD
jgi:peptidoglycan/LPS O-acetylase OafA/YrhL